MQQTMSTVWNGESQFRAIPGGTVTLSDRRTQRQWAVEVSPFELCAVPVTRGQYWAVLGRASDGQGERLPMENVSWWEAVQFCNALSELEGLSPVYQFDQQAEQVNWNAEARGYRLPTEAEWELACRAGSAGPRYGPLDEIAWYQGNAQGRPQEVASQRPNAWGLYDLLGNVWEWCWDLYDPEVYGPYRVLKGGGWADQPWSCRVSVRRRSHPTYRIDDVGFRLARSC